MKIFKYFIEKFNRSILIKLNLLISFLLIIVISVSLILIYKISHSTILQFYKDEGYDLINSTASGITDILKTQNSKISPKLLYDIKFQQQLLAHFMKATIVSDVLGMSLLNLNYESLLDVGEVMDRNIISLIKNNTSIKGIRLKYNDRDCLIFMEPLEFSTFSPEDNPFFTDESNQQKSETVLGYVVLALSLKSFEQKMAKVAFLSVVVAIVMLMVSIISQNRILKYLLSPIKKITEATHRIASGNYTYRLNSKTKDELGQLSNSFDKMAEDLESTIRKLEYQKELVESANKELKDFAYVVSHDLKAPLRAIGSLANWLYTDYGDKFDEEGKELIDLLIKRVNRMNSLINGILQYSRVGRIREKKIPLNLNNLVSEVIEMIAPPENIKIKVAANLPTIQAEKIRIEQLFQNLLSNAIKYMDKPEGLIQIGCDAVNGYWKFKVTDNGPGIEEKYFNKIFQIFQTLKPRDEVESTGIGLTLVKKIIEMYGGEIWVESEIGKGSTFFFTFPRHKNIKGAEVENEKQ